MLEEVWKDVVGYEGLYKISDTGKVKSLRYNTRFGINFEIKQFINRGYYRVILTKNKKPHPCKVHRLVAEAFIPNPFNKTTVNHINGIKTDNRVENLEWATQKENVQHAMRTGLIKTNTSHLLRLAKRNSKAVLQIKNGVVIKEYNSIVEASKENGFYLAGIIRALKGEYKMSSGYEWKYK